jgi:hypothetical protein
MKRKAAPLLPEKVSDVCVKVRVAVCSDIPLRAPALF